MLFGMLAATIARDGRPFGGPIRPAAVFFYSQADAYAEFNGLYEARLEAGHLSRPLAGPMRGASLRPGPAQQGTDRTESHTDRMRA
jgi:hypothetical protein